MVKRVKTVGKHVQGKKHQRKLNKEDANQSTATPANASEHKPTAPEQTKAKKDDYEEAKPQTEQLEQSEPPRNKMEEIRREQEALGISGGDPGKPHPMAMDERGVGKKKTEQKEHKATHCSYKPWCRARVRGRGRDSQRRQITHEG